MATTQAPVVTKAAAKILSTVAPEQIKGLSKEATEVLETSVDALNIKLYTVPELARELKMSVSYIYALIARDKPQVYSKHGKTHLYSSQYLESLRQRPHHARNRKVEILVKPHHQREEAPKGGLLHRMEELESQYTALKQQIDSLTALLGE